MPALATEEKNLSEVSFLDLSVLGGSQKASVCRASRKRAGRERVRIW